MARARTWHLVLLGSAFGIIEAAVVVYLRRLGDPGGSGQAVFVPLPPEILLLEMVREAATLLLLLAASALAAAGGVTRTAVFLVLFGVWDIVYYVVLRLVLGWPARITDWDVLFLLPVPWYAPVYAPLLVAATMLGCGLLMLHEIETCGHFVVRRLHVAGTALGALMILASFTVPGMDAVTSDGYWLPALLGGEGIGLVAFADAWRRTRSAPGG